MNHVAASRSRVADEDRSTPEVEDGDDEDEKTLDDIIEAYSSR